MYVGDVRKQHRVPTRKSVCRLYLRRDRGRTLTNRFGGSQPERKRVTGCTFGLFSANSMPECSRLTLSAKNRPIVCLLNPCLASTTKVE